MKWSIRIALIIAIAGLVASSISASTHYIAANGSDSSSGTSESSPWAHLPGMATWSGNYVPVAGDVFIFRGCDVWTNANFPITWQWSGTSSNLITIDRDPNWYNTSACPSAWNRAVWNAGGTAIAAPENSTNLNVFLHVKSAQYVDFKWIEATGFYWNSNLYNVTSIIQNDGADYISYDSWFIHNWNYGSSAADDDHFLAVISWNNPVCTHCLFTNSVFENQDGAANGGGGIQFSATNNVIHHVSNALKPTVAGTYANNNIYAVQPGIAGNHPNCIETVNPPNPSTNYIYNNLIHDNVECEGFQVGNPGETVYAWNNIWYNNTSSGANCPQIPQGGDLTAAIYFWNNTMACKGPSSSECILTGGNATNWSTAFVVQNNLCITSGTPGGTAQSTGMLDTVINATPTITISNNLVESAATASAQGYTNTETYVYSPTSGTAPTVGAGVNLTGSWPSGFGTTDTAYSCIQSTINGVVQSACNQRTASSRPTSGAWDIGAYSFSSSAVVAPVPPTGVTAIVQ